MGKTQDIVKIDNKYPILEIKGCGETSNVYLVKDPEKDNYYVGKVLKKETDLFEKEVEILNKLKSIHNAYKIY